MGYTVTEMRECRSTDEKIQCAFGGELGLIDNDAIREFVVETMRALAPGYFWTHAASTTGRYHPDISLGEGGLIRHTKLAVWWAIEISKVGCCSASLDEAIAAILLHDLLKNGDAVTSHGMPTLPSATSTHGIYLASKIIERLAPDSEDPEELPGWQQRIIQAVRNHMGRWTAHPSDTDEEFLNNMSELDAMVHLSDYCASRKVDAAYLGLEATRK